MVKRFAEIAFTPQVRAVQEEQGSRDAYARLEAPHPEGRVDGDRLGAAEVAFIVSRDGFYQASVSETGWPYVQFRGGPQGFLKVLDARTLGYADFRGNRQYISVGNLQGDSRVSLILMDYATRRRLKVWARARLVDVASDPALADRLAVPGYKARVERAVLLDVEAVDWNCPQHITPRYTEAEVAAAIAPLRARLAKLEADVAARG